MDERKLRQAGIDYDAALARFVGKYTILEKYLNKFLDDTHLEEARLAYERQDYEEMLEQTHALKGLAGTLGMTELFEVSADIVDDLRGGRTEDLEKKMSCLEKVQEKLCDVIRSA